MGMIMENFNFSFPTQIYFGRNSHYKVGSYIAKEEKVLILYGSDRVIESGVLGEIEKSLKAAGIVLTSVGGIKPNPRLSKVYELIDICINEKITFILAVGGGSVMDTAKAVALGIEDKNIWDYFCGIKSCCLVIKTKVGVIPTIAASGSETSSTTVITNDLLKVWEKRDFSYKGLKPKFAILNPKLTLSVSWEDSACGGIDILSHVLERYFTQVDHTELTDELCEATMRTIIRQLKIIQEDPCNYDARAELMWAGTIAHSNFLSTGRKSDWATHAIEHQISAIYDIKHGTGLSILFPAWMTYVHEYGMDRFSRYAESVWQIKNQDRAAKAKMAISATRRYFKELGQPVSFAELGIRDIDKEFIAGRVVDKGTIGEFHKLNRHDIVNILCLAEGL